MAEFKKPTYFQKHAFPPQINTVPSKDLLISVVIPAFNEPDILPTLNSLTKGQKINGAIEIIVVINESESSSQEISSKNENIFSQVKEFKEKYSTPAFEVYPIKIVLPQKHAGVGLARKIGMDEAAGRFELINKSDGIIVCLDADSLVEENYLSEIVSYFHEFPKTKAASIHFEHPLSGNLDPAIYEGIINYELFLRYYVLGLRVGGSPFPFHTIGSSMVVRSDVYQQQGGMNRRKAGEDFYFLHKLIPLGDFGEIVTTKVIPSPRESDRVPFGTGSAIKKWLENKTVEYEVYHPKTFTDLKVFYDDLPELWKTGDLLIFEKGIPETVASFLKEAGFTEAFKEIKSHSSTESAFYKRMNAWFDGFRTLKYVHFVRDNFYKPVEIVWAVKKLLELEGFTEMTDDKRALLEFLRKVDKREIKTAPKGREE